MNTELKHIRHKWEKKVNHPNCHEWVCIYCGCIKDATNLFNTIYWVGHIPHAKAPSCIGSIKRP